MKKTIPLLAVACLMVAFSADDRRDPVGEEAPYQLDKDKNRTTKMIKSGNMFAKVVGEAENSSEDAYQVNLDYTFKVQFVGTQKGTEVVNVAKEYFSEDFLVNLREDKEFHTEDFKVRHVGFADARNMDGAFYPNCDKLLFYDIDARYAASLKEGMKQAFLQSMAEQGRDISPDGDIENLKLLIHVKYGVPVLGAVKIDVSGKYKNFNLKAGADYNP